MAGTARHKPVLVAVIWLRHSLGFGQIGPMTGVPSSCPVPADRPRERLLSLGPSALTTAELVAILLGTGTARADVLTVAAELLAWSGGTLRQLARKPAVSLQT